MDRRCSATADEDGKDAVSMRRCEMSPGAKGGQQFCLGVGTWDRQGKASCRRPFGTADSGKRKVRAAEALVLLGRPGFLRRTAGVD